MTIKEEKIEAFLKQMRKYYDTNMDKSKAKRKLYHEIIGKKDTIFPKYEELGPYRVTEFYNELTEEIVSLTEKGVTNISEKQSGLKNDMIAFICNNYRIIENKGEYFILYYSAPDMQEFYTIENRKLSNFVSSFGCIEALKLHNNKLYKYIESAKIQETLEVPDYQLRKQIKLYFSVDNTQLESLFLELGERIIKDNINCFAKARMFNSKDQITIRIYDEADLDKMLAIARKYKDNEEQIALMPTTEEQIGITFDDGDSYNSFLSELLVDYFKTTEEINLKTFLTFIKNNCKKRKSQQEMYDTLFLAISKDEVNLEDFKVTFKIKREKDVRIQKETPKKEAAIRNLRTYITSYMETVKNHVLDASCQCANIELAKELFKKAIELEAEKVVYVSDNGKKFSKMDLISAYTSINEYMSEIETTFQNIENLDIIYRSEYEKNGIAGIREVTKNRKSLGSMKKYAEYNCEPFITNNDYTYFLKTKGIELDVKSGKINTRKLNTDLEKVYKKDTKVKIKKD